MYSVWLHNQHLEKTDVDGPLSRNNDEDEKLAKSGYAASVSRYEKMGEERIKEREELSQLVIVVMLLISRILKQCAAAARCMQDLVVGSIFGPTTLQT
jgi:hypothetical protein